MRFCELLCKKVFSKFGICFENSWLQASLTRNENANLLKELNDES